MDREKLIDILLPIKPYWSYLIMKGEKTIEVRKFNIKDPNWSGKFKVYVSKDKASLKRIPESARAEFEKYIGKVAFEFVSDKVVEIMQDPLTPIGQQHACLTLDELQNYGKGKSLYGYRVTALKVYDKPRELGEYKTVRFVRGYHKKNETMVERLQNSKRVEVTYVSKAPQNYIKIMEV